MSFYVDERVSELGRGKVVERRGTGRGMLSANYQGALTSAVWGVLIQVKPAPSTGVLQIEKDALPGLLTTNSASEFWMWGKASFSASRVAPTAEESRPVNISVPAILYLGLPA